MATKRNYWIGIPLLLAGATWFGVHLWNKAPESLIHTDPNHVLEAQQLLRKFQNNTAQSNQLYINQIIQVSGTCLKVESEGDSLYYVYIGGQGNGDVQCQLESIDGPLPKKGDPIQCKGVCNAYDKDADGVMMTRCALTP